TRYSKSDDALLLPLIENLCDKRATNGYRRITAHLNRQLKSGEHAFVKVNPKRIYRIMRLNNLLLQKHTGRVGDNRAHEGKVITLHSNTRWCSDGFEIGCWNKEKVRVVFSLDCCDREVMSYVATTAG
ncbi:IS3 family transposase, partial [Methylophaga pinxianii]